MALPTTPMLSRDWLAYYRRLCRSRFTIVDVETTGLRPSLSRVIEIAVLHATLADGIVLERSDLVNPGVRIPATITQITGITQRMVDAAPLSTEVWREYAPLLSEGVLTAHNLAFDYGFLQAEFNFVAVPYVRDEAEQLCTVQLARLLLSDLPSRRLPDLVQHFGFDVGRSHRAAADTHACWLLLHHLLSQIDACSDDEVLTQLGEQWLSLKAAAELLQISNRQLRIWLREAKIEVQCRGKHNRPMVQRAAIEDLYCDRVAPCLD